MKINQVKTKNSAKKLFILITIRSTLKNQIDINSIAVRKKNQIRQI